MTIFLKICLGFSAWLFFLSPATAEDQECDLECRHAEAQRAYQKANPPRPTVEADKRQCLRAFKGGTADWCEIGPDGMTRFYLGGGAYTVSPEGRRR